MTARGARHLAQQRDLAEEVARPEHPRERSVDRDLEPAALDDVEVLTHLALANDLLAGRGMARAKMAASPSICASGRGAKMAMRAEQRDARSAGHGGDPIDHGGGAR